MNRPDPKQSVRELLEEAHPALVGLSHWIHANPEVGFEENHASDWVNEWLQTAGFEVERGVADMPTALMGRFGSGPFHVAICVEYDALPEVGHACGHNIIAAAGVGAGLALASVADELGLRVSVMGTPAEESGGGKLAFIEAGLFEDVHAAAMVHPWPSDIATPNIIAITQLDVTFKGHEAHAAGFPHLGRNAADAMVIAQTAIGLLRQQLLSTDRVHGIVTKGGDAPNIIPALTTARFMVRAQDRGRLEELTALVRRCFEAGALATGTEVEVVEGTAYANMVHDTDLAALYRHNAEQLGRVLDDEPGAPVSSDMGDVSHVVPSIHPMIGIESNGAVNHQREFAEACATPSADRAILDGALGLAWTVIDAAQNQVIRARLMGEAVIREAVAMVEEVEELDAHADMLEDLAGTVAVSDPELAQQITAAAEALESRADELAEEADVRFEQAQELADEALLDEVTGELESDVEDIVANIETAPFVALEESSSEAQAEYVVVDEVVEVVAVLDETVGATDEGETAEVAWEAAVEAVAEADEGEVDATAENLAEMWGGGELEAQPAEAVAEAAPAWEQPETQDVADTEWAQAVAEAAADTELAVSEHETEAEAPRVGSLGADHAAWERDFQIVATHAAWEEQFLAQTSSAESVEAVAESEWTPETPVAESASEPLEAVAESEWTPETPVAEAESVEAVAEAEFGWTPETPVEAVAVAVAEAESEWTPETPVEAVAEAGEAVAESEWTPETPVEAVAEAASEPVEALAESEWTPEPVAEGDDIWYSGAPDEELPAAERLSEEPVGAAASTDRTEGFVWIPAEDERR